jgi:RHS repeat-associated protein
MVVADDGSLVDATMYHPYGNMEEVAAGNESVRERFTGKEYDKEGGTGNGVDGIRLDYFGARYYDPDLGIWTSPDPAGQYTNAYLYGDNSPLMGFDPDGGWFILTHFILGLTEGTFYGVSPDWWHSKYRSKDDVLSEASSHLRYKDFKTFYKFMQSDKPEGISDAEWKGIKSHLAVDYFNEGVGSRSMSPSESFVEWISGKKWGKRNREGWQDAKDFELALVFTPLAPFVLADWTIGMLNLNAAVKGLEMMIRNDVYIKGMEEGAPGGTITIQHNVYVLQPRANLLRMSDDEIWKSFDYAGVQHK